MGSFVVRRVWLLPTLVRRRGASDMVDRLGCAVVVGFISGASRGLRVFDFSRILSAIGVPVNWVPWVNVVRNGALW